MGINSNSYNNWTNIDQKYPQDGFISDNNDFEEAKLKWQTLEPRLKSVLGVGDFKAWIAPLALVKTDENNIYFIAPNAFARSRIRTEYLHRLQAIWSDFDINKRRIIIDIAVNKASLSDEVKLEDLSAANIKSYIAKSEANNEINPANSFVTEPVDFSLLPKTFDNFEEGASNKIAIAISKRIATETSLGEIVCIHGVNGVGKTHLLSAISQLSQKLHPNKKIVSLSSQRFLNLFQAALRDKDTSIFKEGLRNADILLLDDIQLICGKPATQDEFFQTLSDLVPRGKSVVCTADVPPEALIGLTPRMMGILQSGFNVRMSEPDFELRRKIAINKVKEFALKRADFKLDDPSFDLIAARIIGTGRVIEGAVKQIFASSALIGQEATMEVVAEAIGDRLPKTTKNVPVDTIKKRVAAHFDISLDDLVGTRRHISVARPRQIAMYFSKKLTKRSFPDIAARMGGKDHTTVMHAVKRIEELANKDAKFASELQIIANKILA